MEELKDRVLRYCRDNKLIEASDIILLGLSGGMDSICLLDLLSELRGRISFELKAVHVEHGIRGQASKEDERFVRELCLERGVELKVYNEDVPAFAKKEGLSMEEAARILRYRDFEAALKETEADKIAVAHHLNDQAETVLFNMMRGSSLKGLTGMSPRRGNIIRPLLNVSRPMIEEYVNKKQLSYVNDETNKDINYTRNRVRQIILPNMEAIAANATVHIAKEAGEIAKALEIVDELTDLLYEKNVREDMERGELRLSIKGLKEEKDLICRNLIKKVITRLCRKWKDISSVHIEAVYKLLDSQSGRSLDLPYGILVRRINNELVFSLGREGEEFTVSERKVDHRGSILLPDKSIISCRVFSREEGGPYPQNDYTKWFDYDRIRFGLDLTVRNRREKDRIIVNSAMESQSLKKFFINNKVPSDRRASVKLLAKGCDIVWIIGYRMSEYYKINDDTKNIIEITVKEEEEKE
ncbi:MAG: tRNA lysidine(34) synthetase TilS [Lachnospiraceae bacterium]|nr:tRNA lysidine(34) synthetase TilS [Lachnospiraceae bacterium]